MAIVNFIPQLWSGSILSNLNRRHVFGQVGVVNRNYEGEIRQAGDTVNISSLGRVNVINYTKNTDLSALQVMDDDTTQLLIDQQKAFNVFLDDIDEAQTKPKIRNEITREAAYALANTADLFLAATMVAGAGTTAPDLDATADNAYGALVDLGTTLDENDIPEDGRFAIVPSWFHGLLLQDDRFVASGSAGAESRLANAVIGEAAGFTILKSNNVPMDPDGGGTAPDIARYSLVAGHPMATTFAEQIVKTEAVRNPARFGDNLRGLHVYGAEVVRPEALVVLPIDRT